VNWTYKYKKPSSTGSGFHLIPARVEARAEVSGKIPGEYPNITYRHPSDHANILVVAYATGETTVSMNGTAHLSPRDISSIALAMDEAILRVGLEGV
jgi:hypothetical protein